MSRVLVIEDEEIFREIILDILNKSGLDAIGAENGYRGLQLAKELMPDLVLCDVRMPKLNGYEVLEALRQDPLTANVPFLFLTAENLQNITNQTQRFDANGYLSKPFTTAQLLEAIASYLKK